jgi:uncharacterized Tic20 family protein
VTCALSGGALTIGETAVPLQAIASAALVADMSVPVPAGMPPAPAVALRLGDGSSYFLTPVEQGDAVRLLQAIHTARPDLAGGGPPPGPSYGPSYGSGFGPGYAPPQPGYGYGPGYAPPPPGYGYAPPTGAYAPPGYGAPGYAPPGYAPAGITDGDRTLAGICHLSVFFAPVILPLIVWLAMRSSHPYASRQAKQAFWFHLFMSLITFGGVILAEILLFTIVIPTMPTPDPSTFNPTFPIAQLGIIFAIYGVIGVFSVINIVFSIIAAITGFKGEPYHYPLLGRL